ncbi:MULTISPECIES: hypothetical protein [Marinobacter]|uniref:Uncharacterized protein n=1 Tax=Marinobacter xiaoshiensis TaxID=3073652 RepID=A0ABU2HHH2_9GAMM|nr:MULTISPECIES: hypothetical protein [unclassified Marinobacter]MBK1871635.1 hypothetical protein [Marinobacter sp. 1-3A]MBK1886052.1 hypothetical protein [Marinobacter sp. DY40_1A1]MDS1310510.1 hypothetical protein [Marinobacter sp. F60267]
MSGNKVDTMNEAGAVDRRDRKFSVSTNRGQASHRVRYVETGGASVDIDECTFCEAMPDLSGTGQRQKDEEEE